MRTTRLMYGIVITVIWGMMTYWRIDLSNDTDSFPGQEAVGYGICYSRRQVYSTHGGERVVMTDPVPLFKVKNKPFRPWIIWPI